MDCCFVSYRSSSAAEVRYTHFCSIRCDCNSVGKGPTSTVAVIVFAKVSITETLLLRMFATYTFVPSELTAAHKGSYPTDTVAVTVLVAVSITDILPLPSFVIYANGSASAILTSIKTKYAETKVIKYNLCLSFTYFNPFPVSLVSKIRKSFCEMWNVHQSASECCNMSKV